MRLEHRLAVAALLGAVTLAGPAVLPAQAPAPAIGPRADHAAVVARLEAFVAEQMREKALPALSLALVDDQEIVWARGFGHADPDRKLPATAETVYRVGSVSKLFTDLGVMRLVEQGRLDLDAPVSRYLPEFLPVNPSGGSITLRMLMSHRAGLVREPPVGNYFVTDEPSLAATVRSLNDTALVYAPGARTKYSNAGIATVGYVLEKTQGEPFAPWLQRTVLEPLGLRRSSFEPWPDLVKDLAKAYMWTYDGRVFEAPKFQLGMAPAGSMYSTVTDLGRFVSVLFAGGRGPGGQVVKPETLQAMWTPQFAEPRAKRGFGIGFAVGDLDGRRMVGHNGAIYGFATTLMALPEDKLGVVAVATKDSVNPVVDRIARAALHLMLAQRGGRPLPELPATQPVPADLARRLDGRYRAGDKTAVLTERQGRLFLTRSGDDTRHELRMEGDALVTDDALGYGLKVVAGGDTLVIGKDTFAREPEAPPLAAPARFAGLIGEYGWDHDTLYIYEDEGKLWALIEWYTAYPLKEESESVFRFPDWGLYDGESLVFKRDALGQASEAVAAEVRFVRRPAGPTANGTFLITPLEPVARLRERALDASPPVENVTKVFWDATPADKRIFVADPSQGSRHNRGCAVDLTLFALATGKPVEMPGVYDEMSERSYPGYVGGTALQRWHRERLGDAMEEQDFTVYEFEWWHFDYKDWRQYPILNLPFERLGPAQAGRTPSAEAAPE